MKITKASEADLVMAKDLLSMLDALGHRYCPSMPAVIARNDGDEEFDRDDDDQCGRALRALLEVADRGNLFRVVFGAATMLDPLNKLVDPAADTIEHHPENVAAKQDAAALNWIERQHLEELGMGLVIDAPNDGKYYVCGDSGTTHYGKTLREAVASAIAEGV